MGPIPPEGHAPNFWPMSIVAKRSLISAIAKLFFQYGGRPHLEFVVRVIGVGHPCLVVFISVQNLVAIDAVVSTICTF